LAQKLGIIQNFGSGARQTNVSRPTRAGKTGQLHNPFGAVNRFDPLFARYSGL